VLTYRSSNRALVTFKGEDKEKYVYGLSLTVDPKQYHQDLVLWYPTFCKTQSGLRLVGTEYLFDNENKIHAENDKGTVNFGDIVRQANSIKALGLDPKTCHTVWLSSQIEGV